MKRDWQRNIHNEKKRKNKCKLNNLISYGQGQSNYATNPRLGNTFVKKKKMPQLEKLKAKFKEMKKKV